MNKYLIFYLTLATLFLISCGKSGEYDTQAIESLDKMSETIGDLTACSYSLSTLVIKNDSTEVYYYDDVYMRGPDKMYININGTNGQKGYWYDGKRLAYYSYDNDIYDTVAAPDNIIKAIDFLNDKYGINFPAGDFFYPSLTDDIIEHYNSVLYVGDVVIDDTASISIIASNDEETLQIWIDKATNLPYQMVIEGIDDEYYESTFSNWQLNPELPNLLFEFEPSESSTRVDLKINN